jgi:hypothetical protein
MIDISKEEIELALTAAKAEADLWVLRPRIAEDDPWIFVKDIPNRQMIFCQDQREASTVLYYICIKAAIETMFLQKARQMLNAEKGPPVIN